MSAGTRHHRSELQAIARRAMRERGLEPDFSPAVLTETGAISGPAEERDSAIRDLRHLPWASIDNDDSRDLDQLSVAAPAGGDAVTILVAVADVDAVVRKGSAIDGHAQMNTTSVYTAAEVFPMLPEKLSTDLTSLGEGEERLALVVATTIGPDGAVTDGDVYRARVVNHAKLAYDAVAAWLAGRAPVPPRVAAVPGLDAQLRLQDRVAQAMKELRHHRGALSLATLEPRAVFDGDVLTDLLPDEQNRARELIEDFMITANSVTAKFLEARGFPALRRVLRSPERWERIVALAVDLGERLPPAPDARALEAFLEAQRRADPGRFPDLSLSVVKLLGSGEYELEVPGRPITGHFGLAVKDYTHSTAPNRRYPDLVTQRLVRAALAQQEVPYGRDELGALAAECTLKEDGAQKVERLVRKAAAACLLTRRIGQQFDGIVTGASAKGTWVRVFDPPVEGRVERGHEGLDVGDKVRVRLVHTNPERGFIDFVRV